MKPSKKLKEIFTTARDSWLEDNGNDSHEADFGAGFEAACDSDNVAKETRLIKEASAEIVALRKETNILEKQLDTLMAAVTPYALAYRNNDITVDFAKVGDELDSVLMEVDNIREEVK